MNLDEELADLLTGLATRGLGHIAPRVEAAFRMAATAHAGQQRSDGSPYVVHPLRVTRILLDEWGVTDPDVLQAGLLHDTVEDTDLTLEDLEEHFGDRTRHLVDRLSKPQASDEDREERDRAYYARLADGPAAAVVIKVADRIDNLRDLISARWPEARKRGYVHEAQEKILPLAEAACPEEAKKLRRVAEETLARIDAGEADVPDVGPHQDLSAGGGEDAVLLRSRHLSFFRQGDDVYLFHDLVGDIIQMHEKVLGFLDYFETPRSMSDARTAFASEFMEGDLDSFFETLIEHLVLVPEGQDDREVVADWYPVRGPWIVSHKPTGGGLTLCYKDRRDGDVVVETLGDVLGRVFNMCGGALKVSEIVRRLERQFPKEQDLAGKVRKTIQRWTHSRRQLLKLLPRPREAYELVGLPPYALSTMPYPLLRESVAKPPEPVYGTREYHKVNITSADEQFDVKETTLSHGLRLPHPALGGRTYGSAFAAGLVERDAFPSHAEGTFQAAEVGGGTGYFAKAFLDGLALHAPRVFNRMRYTIVDLSPALRASQRERTAAHSNRVRQVAGDAERLPFGDASLDFLVSNEVIADLRTAAVRRVDASGESGEGGGPGVAVIREYGLSWDKAPGLFFVNLGAVRFLEEIARVLKPGGTAVLTEYGSQTRFPEQSTHLDHAEFSIHFGHLETVAGALGLETSLEQLGSIIGLDESVRVLETTQSFFVTLRAFLSTQGIPLEKVAYTEDMLQELLGERVALRDLDGLRFSPCGNRILGLEPKQFKALIVRKPLTGGRRVKKVSLDL